jgi:hypothetical protein
MPQSAREQVDITALIQGIPNGYPGNSAILSEYLQNSDDAGATKQVLASPASRTERALLISQTAASDDVAFKWSIQTTDMGIMFLGAST